MIALPGQTNGHNSWTRAYPSVLARCAVAQIKDGRLVGGRMNVKDVSSPYCQRVPAESSAK